VTAPDDDPAAYPDMDAIRDAHNAKPTPNEYTPGPARTPQSSGNAAIAAFRASMHIDFGKWHDGIGYDLDALRAATDTERATVLVYLAPPSGWRDVEALAVIDSNEARAAMRMAMHFANAEVRGALLRYAPSVATDDERTAMLVQSLQHGVFFEDLTSALGLTETFHPPRVIHALLRGLFVRPPDIAPHYAAMLAFLYGKAPTAFDWDMRPLFLEFSSEDSVERERAFVRLCALLEIDASATRAEIGTHNEG
jgi:hypothetical protein